MTGRGRGRTLLSPELESVYAEYLKQCSQYGGTTESSSGSQETGGIESRPSTSSSSSAVGVADSSPKSNVSPHALPLARGRGRARQWTSQQSIETNSPIGILSPSTLPSVIVGAESNQPTEILQESQTLFDADFVTKFRSLTTNSGGVGNTYGRGRNISIPPNPSSSDTSEGSFGRGRGRGGVDFWKKFIEPGIGQPLAKPQVGVEDFSVLEQEVVVRKGENGKLIPVVANFIRLSVAKESGLFEYHVDFEPLLESVRTRRYILRNHEAVLGKIRTFDGAKLYLPFKLQDLTVLNSPNPNDPEQSVRITIRFIKKNQMGECVHFYNVLLRRIMEKLGLQEVNRNFYDYRTIYRLPQYKIEIWPGYVTAVDEVEGGLMLCCDVSHRVLRTATLLDAFNDMRSSFDSNPSRLKQEYTNYVVSQIVLTRYNNRNYRVDDVAWDLTPKSTFELSNGEKISYMNYYKQQYDITITDLEQPLLVHRPKQNKIERGRHKVLELVCLIPECSFMTGLTTELAKDHKIMKDVAEYTRVPPNRRRLAVKEYINKIRDNDEASEILNAWGLSIEDGGIELSGRCIAPPTIILNENKSIKGQIDFGNDSANNPCLEPIPINDWAIFCNSIDKPRADTFVQTYRHACRKIGIELKTDANVCIVYGERHRLVENFSQTLIKHLNIMKHLQFVVVIVPAEITELYAAIKRICCIDRPIPSQVILSKTLGNERQLRIIVAKIALQINCKLGGGLWTIRIPLVEKIMFVGIDVYHDPRNKNASVLALVASLNEAQTKYYSRIVSQRTHQEVSDSLRAVFMDCMNAYQQRCGAWPDRVVVFRDGVGDGQLELTKATEVTQMLSVLGRNCGDNLPKFTFVVVQKRISCRIFAQDPYNSSNYTNPPPGTVLDHTVTRRHLFDFFLVSQLVRQGTVSPTHYIVLDDNSNVKPDLIQKFAFANSFLYYNWGGPIRVPAVCQYAHKLAFVVGQYIKDSPSQELNSQLYYL